MNILILSWRGPKHPNAGGAEISTHEHAKRWVRAGNKVTVFTSSFSKASREEFIDGVKIIRRGSQVGVQWEAFKWYLWENKFSYDVVIDQFHGIPFFTPLYIKKHKLAFIHEVTKEVWSLNPWPKPLNFIPSILGPLVEPLIFSLYKNIRFMTVSESTKKDLISWGIPKANIFVIHNGFSKIDKLNIEKENTKTLIFLGALSKDKGIEEALKIFSLIDKVEKNWEFWVVGKSDPKYLLKIKDMVKTYGLTKNTKFWGYVSENKKFELLRRAHILINSSIREGWGLVVIEASSMGTPTVAFDVPGLRDSVVDRKTGFLCPRNNYKGIAEKILTLLKNNKKYAQMSRGAILWSNNFSWDKSSMKSLKLINSLTKNRQNI